jgi:predicted transglutaminase-like cysteine proteinase
MKKRLSVTVTCVALLGLVVISGLSCASSAAYPVGSTAGAPSTTESQFQSYVTPERQSVQETLYGILGAPPYELTQTGLDDIRDWVADNIDYKSDEEQWGEDYWQTPDETLRLRTGDCEDFSILLCSLLRAYGFDAEQVFVALGDDGQGEGHAFVIEDWNQNGDWGRIEPQAPTRVSSLGWFNGLKTNPDAELDNYDITVAFNDLYYTDNSDSFSWSADKANVWRLSDLTRIVRDMANGLSRVTQYLWGLLFG